MNFLSRYSYAVLTVLLVALGTGVATQSTRPEAWGMGTLTLAAVLIIFWVLARRGALTPVNPEKRIRRSRSSVRPVVVHFYSDWDMVSLFKRSLAARVEKEYKGRFDWIFIDVNHPDADSAAEYTDAGLGDYVLYDAAGEFVTRCGMVSAAKLENVLERPAK